MGTFLIIHGFADSYRQMAKNRKYVFLFDGEAQIAEWLLRVYKKETEENLTFKETCGEKLLGET